MADDRHNPANNSTDLEDLEESYSTHGPKCPKCGTEYTPDEGFYYDQSGYELDCDE